MVRNELEKNCQQKDAGKLLKEHALMSWVKEPVISVIKMQLEDAVFSGNKILLHVYFIWA